MKRERSQVFNLLYYYLIIRKIIICAGNHREIRKKTYTCFEKTNMNKLNEASQVHVDILQNVLKLKAMKMIHDGLT